MVSLMGEHDATTVSEPHRVFVVAPDGGPARARAEQLARRLADGATVRLVGSSPGTIPVEESPEGLSLDEGLDWADVAVLIISASDFPLGTELPEIPVVVDFSTLDVVQWLVDEPPSGPRAVTLASMLERADLVLAADQRQRDILLGALAGQVRVNAAVYDRDPSLLSLVRADADGLALAEFCARPVRAADSNLPPYIVPARLGTLALAAKHLREGGPRVLAEKALGRITRVFKQQAARTR